MLLLRSLEATRCLKLGGQHGARSELDFHGEIVVDGRHHTGDELEEHEQGLRLGGHGLRCLGQFRANATVHKSTAQHLSGHQRCYQSYTYAFFWSFCRPLEVAISDISYPYGYQISSTFSSGGIRLARTTTCSNADKVPGRAWGLTPARSSLESPSS